MRLYGSIKELVSAVFRSSSDNKEVTIQAPATLSGASSTLTTPDVLTDTLSSTTSTESITNKTITDASNNISATQLTSGTIPDARVASSSVTQHVGSIDHDSLLNFVANEHLDWTADQGATDINDANIAQTAVTQHEAALSIDASSQLTSAAPIANGGTGQTTKTASFDALSPNTTKGDIISRDGSNNIRVAVGTDGQVLTADSGEASGLGWSSPLVNPMTTQGDIIKGGTSGAAERLAIGSSGQILSNDGSDAEWIWSNINSVSSANYTILDTDGYHTIEVNTGASDRTVTLPTVADNSGRAIVITKTDSGAGYVIIDGEGAETVNGDTTVSLHHQYDSITVQSNGSEWFIVRSARKNRVIRALLSSDISSDSSANSDLTITGLTIGRQYRVSAQMVSLSVDGGDTTLNILQGSTTFARISQDSNEPTSDFEQMAGSIASVFTCTNTTLTVNLVCTNNGSIINGNNTTAETYVQLEELYDTGDPEVGNTL